MIKDVTQNGIKVLNGYVNTGDNRKHSYLNTFGKKCIVPTLAAGVIGYTLLSLSDALGSFWGSFKEAPKHDNYRPQRR